MFQHFVGLVEDQVLELPDVERSPVQMVEYPARRSDDHVDALGQSAELLAHRSAAVDGRDRQLAAAVQRQQFFGHLQRQLARQEPGSGPAVAPLSGRSRSRIGRPNAAVLPVPVWACAMMSFVFSVSSSAGIVSLCMGDGVCEAFRANRLERPVGQPEGAEFFCLSHV